MSDHITPEPISTRDAILQSLQKPLIQHLLLFLAVMCMYVPTFWYTFVWDDWDMIGRNPYIRSWKYLPLYFTDPGTFVYDPWNSMAKAWRPLRNIYYLLTYKVHGLHPTGWHFNHVLLHSILSIVILAFYHRAYRFTLSVPQYLPLPGKIQIATWLAVFMWAVHPINNEITGWVKSADDILSCLFGIGAFIVLLPPSQILTYKRVFLASILYTLALLAKESIPPIALILPLFFMLLSPMPIHNLLRNKPRLLAVFLFLLLSVIYVILRKLLLGKLEQVPYLAGSFSHMMATMTTAWVRYLQLILWPFWPTQPIGDYQGWPLYRTWNDPAVISSLCILAAFAVALVPLIRRNRIFAAGIAFFLLAVLPVANIIPMMQVMAERFMYFPLIGIALAVSVGLNWLLSKNQVIGLLFSIVIVTALCVTTQHNLPMWLDNKLFYESAMERLPDNRRAKHNVANQMVKEGNTTGALVLALSTLKEDRPDFDSAMMVASILYQTGSATSTTRYLEKIINIFPDQARPHGFLGDIERNNGNLKQALEYYNKAVKIDDKVADLWYWKGITEYELKQTTATEASLEKAVQLNSSHTSAAFALKALRSQVPVE